LKAPFRELVLAIPSGGVPVAAEIAQARAKVERRNARLLWSDVDEDDAAAPLGL